MVLILKRGYSAELRKQLENALRKKKSSKKKHDWKKYFGKVKWDNPVKFQRNLRND